MIKSEIKEALDYMYEESRDDFTFFKNVHMLVRGMMNEPSIIVLRSICDGYWYGRKRSEV